MDFFMENEDLCKVQNLSDLQDGPQNSQADYIAQCFSNLEIFQNRLLQYSGDQIFPGAFFNDDMPSNESASRG